MKPINISIKSPKQTAFAAAKENVEKIKLSLADIIIDDECCDDSVSQEDLEGLAEVLFYNIDSMYRAVNDLYSRMYDMQDNFYQTFYNHLKGHLPAINSVEQMTRAIDALGLSSEIDVQKRTIYASDGAPEKLVLEIPLKK